MGASLLIGPVDRRTDLSREMERANTHNELAGYRDGAVRVKTPVRNRGTLPCPAPYYAPGSGPPAPPPRGPPTVPDRYRSRATRVSSQTGSGAS